MLPPNRKLQKLTSNVTNQRPRRSSLANLAGGRGREILLGTWHVPHRAGPILEGYHVKAEAMHDVAMHAVAAPLLFPAAAPAEPARMFTAKELAQRDGYRDSQFGY